MAPRGLRLSLASGGRGSGGFVHDAITRFMGLIVIAMGVQFALTGMRSFMRETTPTLTYSDRRTG